MNHAKDRLSGVPKARRSYVSSSALDEERQASMADEGGVSGALMEVEDVAERRRLQSLSARGGQARYGRVKWVVAFALGALAVGAVRWLRGRDII